MLNYIMNKITLKGTVRTEQLSAKDKTTIIPGIMYGKGLKNTMLNINREEFSAISEKHGTKLLCTISSLEVDGKIHDVIVQDISFHPVNGAVLTVDFYMITSDIINIKVPITTVNEGKSPGIRDGALFFKPARLVNIRCNKNDIPNAIVVDLNGAAKNFVFYAHDLKDFKHYFPKNQVLGVVTKS